MVGKQSKPVSRLFHKEPYQERSGRDGVWCDPNHQNLELNMSNIRMLQTPLQSVELFRAYLGDLDVQAITELGVMLCKDQDGAFFAFDPETTEPEDVGVSWDEAMDLIAGDPEIIDESIRLEALASMGPIADDQVYSLKVEQIVGGKQIPANMEIRSIDDHFDKVHAIVEAVKNDPEGTVYDGVRFIRK
jgi:hypothetical protein